VWLCTNDELIHPTSNAADSTGPLRRATNEGDLPRNCLHRRYDFPTWTRLRLIGHKQGNSSDHKQDNMPLLQRFSSPFAIHGKTPVLVVSDSRGLPVRDIAYCRTETGTAAQARINVQWHDVAGRSIAQWDPRQFSHFEAGLSETPNQRNCFSLSGVLLRQKCVDSGWRVSLQDSLGQPRQSWDSRAIRVTSHYDEFARLVAVEEQDSDGQTRTRQRLTYAGANAESAALNLCGGLTRQDDDVGSLFAQGLSITGQTMRSTRRYLAAQALPDWPAGSHARDALLEPGSGYLSTSAYDACGSVTANVDAMGNQQTFTCNLNGLQSSAHLLSATGVRKTLLLSVDYDAAGRSVTQALGNGMITRSTYSSTSQNLTRQITTRQDGTVLQDLSYEYDPVGNVLVITDSSQSVGYFANQRTAPINRYAYDSLYQLIEATGRETAAAGGQGPGLPELQPLMADSSQWLNYTQSYKYDEASNLRELRHVNGQQSHTRRFAVAQHSNRSLPEYNSELPDEAQLAEAFDGNGNLLQWVRGQDATWDLRDQLHRVTTVRRDAADNDHECYFYDASGNRLRKISSVRTRQGAHSSEVRYLPGLEIRTDSRTGERLHVVVAQAGLSGVRLLHWHAGKPAQLDNDQLRYSLGNHLGCATLEVDGLAQLISREEYYPFGGTACRAGRSELEASYKTIRYCGKERDASGLYYYGMRYYAPWLMRWINPDPAGDSDGLNLYCMVGNNPVTFVDIMGLQKGKYQLEGESREDYKTRKQKLDRTVNQRIARFNQSINIVNENINAQHAAFRNSSDASALAQAATAKVAMQTVSAVASSVSSFAAGAGTLAVTLPVLGPGAPVAAFAAGTVASKATSAAVDYVGTKVGVPKTINIRSGAFKASSLLDKAEAREGSIDGQIVAKLKSTAKAVIPYDFDKGKVDNHKLQKLGEEVGKGVVGAFVPGGKVLKQIPDFARIGQQAIRAAQGSKDSAKIDEMIYGVMTTIEELMYQLDEVSEANWRGNAYPGHLTNKGLSHGPSLQSMANKLNSTVDNLEGMASILAPGFEMREGYMHRRATVVHM